MEHLPEVAKRKEIKKYDVIQHNKQRMKKQIGYRLGYRIIIRNEFYEVTEGKKAVYYGECRKNSTYEEADTYCKQMNNGVEFFDDMAVDGMAFFLVCGSVIK